VSVDLQLIVADVSAQATDAVASVVSRDRYLVIRGLNLGIGTVGVGDHGQFLLRAPIAQLSIGVLQRIQKWTTTNGLREPASRRWNDPGLRSLSESDNPGCCVKTLEGKFLEFPVL
jgi:hypothetical protein